MCLPSFGDQVDAEGGMVPPFPDLAFEAVALPQPLWVGGAGVADRVDEQRRPVARPSVKAPKAAST